MQQTLLSLAALFSFSMLGYIMHAHVAETEAVAQVNELESAALSLAVAWADRVKGLAFDEADVNALSLRSEGDVTGLTAPGDFGPEAGEADLDAFDDVDDLHGTTFRAAARVGHGTQPYDVSFTVQYVDPLALGTPSAGMTTAKQVVVNVQEVRATTDRPAVVAHLAVPLTPAKLFLHR